MSIDSELLSGLPPEELNKGLADWRWLVGEGSQPILLTLSGDLFLENDAGAVVWLETGGGELEVVAASTEEFWLALEVPENRREWLLENVVRDLLAEGHRPGAHECFGYKILPVFGGSYDGANRVSMSATEHISLTGHVHQQIRDLPDGATVQFDVFD